MLSSNDNEEIIDLVANKLDATATIKLKNPFKSSQQTQNEKKESDKIRMQLNWNLIESLMQAEEWRNFFY